MNYRHAFHAGNHADCLKHWILALTLRRLAQKPMPFAMLDTHAGLGWYDLDSAPAQRCPEWRDGVARLWDWPDAPDALRPWLDLVRAANPDGALRRYPGSPALALALMRPQDRLIACELHPEDAPQLRAALGCDRRLELHQRDGYAALAALSPPKERRGLILIDPPYEDRDADIARSVAALKSAIARWRGAMCLWWRPLMEPGAIARADGELAGLGLEMLRADLVVDAPSGLSGSSMLALNPAFGLAGALETAGVALAERLAQGAHARFRLRPT